MGSESIAHGAECRKAYPIQWHIPIGSTPPPGVPSSIPSCDLSEQGERQQQTQPTYGVSNPGWHWWEASDLTAVSSLFPLPHPYSEIPLQITTVRSRFVLVTSVPHSVRLILNPCHPYLTSEESSQSSLYFR